MKKKRIKFGVAGNPPNFWKSEYKKERANAPEWLNSIGLEALEIQCTYGVRMPDSRAKLFLQNSKKFRIELSIHAPYYISLGSPEVEKKERSLLDLTKALNLAKKIGSKKIIFHLGGAKGERKEALKKAISSLQELVKRENFGEVYLYPEIAGKIGQLGSLEEIIEVCKKVKNTRPCLDLAHLHARTHGTLKKREDFQRVFEKIEKELGKKALQSLHLHHYSIAWGKGGETIHKAFSDTVLEENQLPGFGNQDKHYFPRYEPLLEFFVERKLYPTIICEAKNTQDEGALEMKKYCLDLLQKRQK